MGPVLNAGTARVANSAQGGPSDTPSVAKDVQGAPRGAPWRRVLLLGRRRLLLGLQVHEAAELLDAPQRVVHEQRGVVVQDRVAWVERFRDARVPAALFGHVDVDGVVVNHDDLVPLQATLLHPLLDDHALVRLVVAQRRRVAAPDARAVLAGLVVGEVFEQVHLGQA